MTWAGGPHRIQEIDGIEGLERLRQDWTELCDLCPWSTPFQRPEWLLPWCRHFEPDDVWVLALHQEDRLVGLAPFFIYTRPRWGGAPGDPWEEKAVALLGSGNSDYLDVLLHPEMRASAGIFLSHLAAHPDRWDVCDLEQLRPASPLLAASLPAGWTEEVRPLAASPVLQLHGSVEALGQVVPARQLKNLRQFRRRAGRLGSLRVATASEQEWDTAFAELVRLHGARWRERGQLGVLEGEEMQAFHRDVIRGFGAREALALHTLHLDDHVVAVYYGFYEKEDAFFYLHGFDPSWSRWSPGVILVGAAIEEAAGRGAERFDFLQGEEAYKYHWGAENRPNFLRRLRPTA